TVSSPMSQEQQLSRAERESLADRKLGSEYAKKIEEGLKLSEDPALLERVQRIGSEIAEIANTYHFGATFGDPAHHKYEYVFKVVAGDDVNAFSVPGGFIYIYEGLIKLTQSDDELAGVLAHEVAHAANRHLIVITKKRSRLETITLPLIIGALLTGSKYAGEVLLTSDLLMRAVTNGMGQEAEQDADRTAFFYLTKTRYNPTGLLTFLERLAFRDRNRPTIDWGVFQTHPPTAERAKAILRLMKEHNVPIERSKVTTSFRVVLQEDAKGVNLLLGEKPLFTLKGEKAKDRAEETAGRLNSFFDAVPEPFQVVARGNELFWGQHLLVQFQPEDAGEEPLSTFTAKALKNLKDALFSLSMRIFRD
ncbi:MAG: M48 family metalloprotease, partial [candidate division KSB1 bacterium]|nr:M48 family metalloprotease [candidate division KSB1 bacterium]